MTGAQKKALKKVVAYLWDSEEKHYEEMYGELEGKAPTAGDHVFTALWKLNYLIHTKK
jgi:hypothetical protein